jgi:hypothetical protein
VWLKVTDTAFDDPRLVALGRSARLLHFEALAYSNRHVTGGLISTAALARLTDDPDPETSAKLLVAVGLWEAAEDGHRIIWLLDDQPGVGEINRQATYNRERQAKRRRHLHGDHSDCDPRFCDAARLGVTGDITRDRPKSVLTAAAETRRNALVTPPRPDPTRPDRREGIGSRGKEEGSALPALARSGLTAVRAAAAERGDDDDDSICDRCEVVLLDDEGKVRGNDIFCPTCIDYRRADPEACMALKKDTGETCMQRVKEGQHFCQYHRQPRSRGTDPSIGQEALDRLRATYKCSWDEGEGTCGNRVATEGDLCEKHRKKVERRAHRTAALALEAMTPAERREAIRQEMERSQYEYDERYHGDELDRAAGKPAGYDNDDYGPEDR